MKTSRNTLQREIVHQTVLSMRGHVTAEMIYDKIHAVHPSISRATVYRNLRTLEVEGKIMRIDVLGGADCYEARAWEHYHIRCEGCGRLFDAALPYIPKLVEMEQAADSEFEICACSLLFVGYCPECRQRREEMQAEQSGEKPDENLDK